MSPEIHVLSAGAIEPGLIAAAEAFREQSGQDARITWATTPVIRKRIGGGEVPDVVIATEDAVGDFERDGMVAGQERVTIGRVGIGVVMRKTAPAPDLSSAGALKYAVLDADSVVYNRASSGLYVEQMLAEMGILDRIRSKTSRYGNGPAMMEHLINGKGKEIGFGAIIEILMFRDRGLKLAAPLPPEIQHYASYAAAPMTAASNPGGARTFTRYLATPPARALFAAHGVE
ncbi:MAG: substrate-binding domain-containing protein [Betaproteobacteria bacterium]|nr:substrate-binding domain-containing protein [Betaproteobacteria bacterium]